jgi:hypothetical protein
MNWFNAKDFRHADEDSLINEILSKIDEENLLSRRMSIMSDQESMRKLDGFMNYDDFFFKDEVSAIQDKVDLEFVNFLEN